MCNKYQQFFQKNGLGIILEAALDEKDSWNQKSLQAAISAGSKLGDNASSVKSLLDIQKSINARELKSDRSQKMILILTVSIP